MPHKKENEEAYTLTLKGFIWSWLLSNKINISLSIAENLVDALYLWVHKNKGNTILFDEGETKIVKIEKVDKEP